MIQKTVIIAGVIFGILVLIGVFWRFNTPQKEPLKEVFVENRCEQEYASLLNRNKQSYENCSVVIRDGEFEEREVERKQNKMVLILDVSGSMAGLVEGRAKIDIAKEAAYAFFDSMESSSVDLSVVLYGHKGNNSASEKATSCAGIEEIYYMGAVSSDIAKKKIADFSATGWTPIEASLRKAESILSDFSGEGYNNSILLISDGKETCGGDPVAVAKELQDSGLHITANVIGFDVGGEDERQLQAIAQNGGGEYFSVNSLADFEYAFQKHEAFMEKFDFMMKRLSESLTDLVRTSDTYFACLGTLKKEQAHMMLDIYADKKVSDTCAKYADTAYHERYSQIEAQLEHLFEENKKAWDANNSFAQ